MYCLFLGAGFSKWAVDLPLVNELFDFNVNTFNQADEKRIEVANGLHPYDWTGRVRRVWRGNPLFS